MLLLAIIARVASRSQLFALAELGFPSSVSAERSELPSCGADFRGRESNANGAVFDETLSDLQRRFKRVFVQNLRTFVARSREIYKRSDEFAKNSLSEDNYPQILRLRRAMIAIARRAQLKRLIERLSRDPSCMNAQLALMQRSSCAAAHADASEWASRGRRRYFSVAPEEAASVASSCAGNMQLSCKLAPLMYMIDPENRAARRRARNCAALRRWRRCHRGGGDCSPRLGVVMRRFFSPAGLLVTNGYGRAVWIGGKRPSSPFHYSMTPPRPQL